MNVSNEQLQEQLIEHPSVNYVNVSGDGYHYQLVIVSDEFIGKSKVQRSQWVYKELKNYITTGQLHALTMKTWTKDEWEKKRG